MIIGELEFAHENPRRRIDELNGDGFSIQLFTVGEKGFVSAPHYHGQKSETFVIIKGQGEVILNPVHPPENEQRKMPGEYVGKRTKSSVIAGSVVHFGPKVAHQFKLEPGSVMICFSSEAFDPDNKDMISYEL